MNEEELKKKIRRLSKENHTKYYDDDYGEDLEIDNDKEIERLKRILEGFQKGKLEQKKEELERVKKLKDKLEWYLNYQGSSKDIEKYLFNWLEQIFEIKQLQKEIGGI